MFKAIDANHPDFILIPIEPQQYFQNQVRTLQAAGLDLTPEDVTRLQVLVPENHRFIVVPRRPDNLDLNHLMNLVDINGIRGRNELDSRFLSDLVDVPKGAHLLIANDGHERDRIAYPLWYGLVHVILFPLDLVWHPLDMIGSRYKDNYVPRLLLHNHAPVLGVNWNGYNYPRCGTPITEDVVEG